MTRTTCGLAAVFLASSALTAAAGGIERVPHSSRVLFEEGRYFEFSTGFVMPDHEGTAGAGAPTDNIFENYLTFGAAYKADINDRLSYALVFDTPWGVDTEYTAGPPYTGTVAELTSYSLTGFLAYDVTDRFKVFGGVRGQSMEAEAAIPFVGGYTIDADRTFDVGWTAGVAYSIPDIALRVALTYNSEIDHTLDSTEFGAIPGTVDVSTPQSVNLDFQTGIAKDTLLFGSIRWVDWSEFSIEPPNYPLGVLVDYEEDWITYSLGIGRRFNENWSGALSVSYEPASDTVLTTLGPVDGRWSVGVAGTYTQGNMKVTGGVQYFGLGDAENVLGTQFEGDAIAAGLRVGFYF